ncbi:hypothetical protein AB0937_06220 [Streptomyces sp. NPDC047880]|uniref:hypothetical protein n=1 Tax=Streptomyces sp. NPDC047880 TaxID=3155626 RepID=UPI0034549E74
MRLRRTGGHADGPVGAQTRDGSVPVVRGQRRVWESLRAGSGTTTAAVTAWDAAK